MSAHNMFSRRNKKNINLLIKKVSYLALWNIHVHNKKISKFGFCFSYYIYIYTCIITIEIGIMKCMERVTEHGTESRQDWNNLFDISIGHV